MDRSGFCTVVGTQDWLSPTRAQSVKVPALLPNTTVTVKLVSAPEASGAASEQVTTCPGPADGTQLGLDEDTNVSPAGRVSVTVIGRFAVAEPTLLTLIVYDACELATAVAGPVFRTVSAGAPPGASTVD